MVHYLLQFLFELHVCYFVSCCFCPSTSNLFLFHDATAWVWWCRRHVCPSSWSQARCVTDCCFSLKLNLVFSTATDTHLYLLCFSWISAGGYHSCCNSLSCRLTSLPVTPSFCKSDIYMLWPSDCRPSSEFHIVDFVWLFFNKVLIVNSFAFRMVWIWTIWLPTYILNYLGEGDWLKHRFRIWDLRSRDHGLGVADPG